MTTDTDKTDKALSEFYKVIFLDIEGVVVTHKSILFNHTEDNPYRGARKANWSGYIDRLCLGLVYKLAHDYKAQIVVTSTLRKDKYCHTGLLSVAPTWLNMITSEISALDYLSNAVTEHRSNREEEIAKFVEDFEVKQYVVFDDRALKCPNFVQVSPYDGLSLFDYNSAKPFLLDAGEEIKYEGIFL